jgi:peptide deformylase
VTVIRTYGDPILRKRAEEVKDISDELKGFMDRLVVDMVENDGVGLAAPQVGRSVRIVVVDITIGEQEPIVLVNPEIIWSSEETEDDEEGCLSVPDIRLKVNRPVSVTVKARDRNGAEITIERADGFYARALQHEIDHLNGILFVDRVAPIYRQLISGKLKKLAKLNRDNAKSD